MRAFPMIRSLKGAILMTALMAVPLIPLSASLLSGLYGVGLILLCYPLLLMITGAWGGLLPFLAGLLAGIGYTVLMLDWHAGLLMCLFLLPFALAFIVLVSKRVRFVHTALALCGIYLVCGFGVLYVLQNVSNGDLYRILAQRFAGLIAHMDDSDRILALLYQNGLIRLDSSLLLRAQGLLGGLSALGRQELTASLTGILADSFSQTPSLIMSSAVFVSFGGLALALHIGRRSALNAAYAGQRRRELMEALDRQREEIAGGNPGARLHLESYEVFLARMAEEHKDAAPDFPDLQLPPFSEWYLPRGAGLMAAVPAIGLMMSVLGTSIAERTVGMILGALFTSVYMLQGLSAFDFLQKKANRSPAGRLVVTALILFLFRQLFVLIGLAEQVTNFRRLRRVQTDPGE